MEIKLLTLGLVPERIFMRHVSDKIKDHWQPSNPHCITMLHTTKSPDKEQTYIHLPPDPYLVKEKATIFSKANIYLFKTNKK